MDVQSRYREAWERCYAAVREEQERSSYARRPFPAHKYAARRAAYDVAAAILPGYLGNAYRDRRADTRYGPTDARSALTLARLDAWIPPETLTVAGVTFDVEVTDVGDYYEDDDTEPWTYAEARECASRRYGMARHAAHLFAVERTAEPTDDERYYSAVIVTLSYRGRDVISQAVGGIEDGDDATRAEVAMEILNELEYQVMPEARAIIRARKIAKAMSLARAR